MMNRDSLIIGLPFSISPNPYHSLEPLPTVLANGSPSPPLTITHQIHLINSNTDTCINNATSLTYQRSHASVVEVNIGVLSSLPTRVHNLSWKSKSNALVAGLIVFVMFLFMLVSFIIAILSQSPSSPPLPLSSSRYPISSLYSTFFRIITNARFLIIATPLKH
jgi:hypothetical protein